MTAVVRNLYQCHSVHPTDLIQTFELQYSVESLVNLQTVERSRLFLFTRDDETVNDSVMVIIVMGKGSLEIQDVF